MKIAIITYAFYESTFPLFKHLSEFCDVDLYCLFNNKFLTPPSFDISGISVKSWNKSYNLLSKDIIPKAIKNYLGKTTSNVRIYLFKQNLNNLLWNNYALANYISQKRYDCIHLINLSSHYLPIIKKNYKSTRIIYSLHESNLARASVTKINFKNIIKIIQREKAKRGIKYVNYFTFFSYNERQKFFEKNKTHKFKTSVIKFGLFETFKNYSQIIALKNGFPKNYYLYIGYIRPYKGVDFLLKIIKENEILNQYHFIIAGKDDMGISISHNFSNVTFINKFLTDQEITALVSKAKALILPYQNASQSGLPNLAFCFNKPIIYSDIAGLNEYLTNNYNGISFSVNNAKEFKDAIIKMEKNEIYKKLQDNIRKYPFKEDLSWRNIALKFINLYNSALLQ